MFSANFDGLIIWVLFILPYQNHFRLSFYYSKIRKTVIFIYYYTVVIVLFVVSAWDFYKICLISFSLGGHRLILKKKLKASLSIRDNLSWYFQVVSKAPDLGGLRTTKNKMSIINLTVLVSTIQYYYHAVFQFPKSLAHEKFSICILIVDVHFYI